MSGSADDATIVALDVGGTAMKGAIVGPDLTPVARLRAPTPRGDGPDPVLEAVASLIDRLGDLAADGGYSIAGVGVVIPGIVDEVRGVAVRSENIGWHEVPVRELLARRTGRPVALGHDVRAAGLAEARIGAARGLDDVLFLPIGTGIAAALVLGGRPYDAEGYAGEIGHVDVGHGEPCVCGGTGCLEAIASAAAIARRYGARSGRPVAAAAEVERLMSGGDAIAEAVWNEAVEALALALSWVVAVLAPQAVVVGGGLARAGELLLDPLGTTLEDRLTFQRRPRILPAALGDEAGVLGAALLASDHLLGAGS